MDLGDAIERLQLKDFEGALAALLEAWRARRLPALADIIDELNAPLCAARAPLTWSRIDDAIPTWRRYQESTVESERGHVLSMLLHHDNRHKDAMVPDLATWKDDPRVANVLVKLAEVARSLTWVPRSPSMWKQAFAQLAQIGDVRIVARLEALAKRESETSEVINRIARHAAALAPRLSEAATGLVPSESELAELERLRRALAPSRQSARSDDELLAAIYAHPDDDEPRLVYADFLTEKGDPRGELIVLQMAGATRPLSDEERRREAMLLAPNVRPWLGPLEPAISSWGVRYERGFVVACGIGTVRPPLLDHPAWATVRELRGKFPHPFIHRLRAWSDIYLNDVVSTCERGVMTALGSLEISGWSYHTPAELAVLGKLLDETEALPRLRQLSLKSAADFTPPAPSVVIDTLLLTRVGRQLEELSWPVGYVAIVPWRQALDAAPLSSSLTAVRLDSELCLRRGPDGRLSSLAVHYDYRWPGDLFAKLRPVLETLPEGLLSRVAVSWEKNIRPAKTDHESLRALLARLAPSTECSLQER